MTDLCHTPADPDADLIEFTAEKIHGDIGCDADWPCVSHAESIRRETRGLIEAVRRLAQDVLNFGDPA